MDSRIIGIIGGVLLIIGTFCPLVGVDFLGQTMNVSFIGSVAGTSWDGLLLLLFGIAGIALAVLRKYRLLLIPGILSLAIVAYNYFSFKSKMAEMLAARGPEAENAVSMKWGWIVLILGGLALVAAGALNTNAPAPGSAWGATPPPPPPYTPGR